jgi:hypothetical protein
VQCGYFSSFFDILGALAQAAAATVVAIAQWLNNDLVGQLNLTPAIAQLRYVVYDIILRLECACEGTRGLGNVVTIGLINDQSTVVDLTINYAFNSVLSVPQVLFASIIASVRTNMYDPPDTDYVVNQLEGLVTNLGPLLNQLTHNFVTFVENLLNLGSIATFGERTASTPAYAPHEMPRHVQRERSSAALDWCMLGMTMGEKCCGNAAITVGARSQSMIHSDLLAHLRVHLLGTLWEAYSLKSGTCEGQEAHIAA